MCGGKKTWLVKLINGPYLCSWKSLNDSSLKVHLIFVAFRPNMCSGKRTGLVKLINGPSCVYRIP